LAGEYSRTKVAAASSFAFGGLGAMTVSSMTGFARASGSSVHYHWAWELKTVNAKGLDLRLRLPATFDALEIQARALIAIAIARGACQATLSAAPVASTPTVRINQELLAALLEAIGSFPATTVQPASFDGLLNIRGVIEIVDSSENEAAQSAASAGVLATLEDALAALLAMRRQEGAALLRVIEDRLDAIARLTAAAAASPSRAPEAIRVRLLQTIAELTQASSNLDPNRLYQEAMLMAAKADIREELDRLSAHVAACRALVQTGGPIGRRLDFLAQEFGREANTLCAKSNSVALTAIGLDLKAEIEQFREQIQNIE
jgi:uncharacterized protein (TIGR00255 family)